MPSYCIHIAHGLETLNKLKTYLESNEFQKARFKKLKKCHFEALEAIVDQNNNDWRKQFMTGLILPDAAKKSTSVNNNQLDRNAHYPKNPNGYFKTPDVNKFFKEYPLSLDNPLSLGYAIHLYLDARYDELLQEIFYFDFNTSGTLNKIVYNVRNNTNGQLEKSFLSEGVFWTKIYNDYTRLNPYYVQKKKFDINNFVSLSNFSPMISSQFLQFFWYKELYECMEKDVLKEAKEVIHNDNVDEQKSQLELLDVSIIDKLIDRAADDFLNLYLKPLIINKKCNNKSKKSDKKENDNWNAELIKLEYYRTKWDELASQEPIAASNKLFFNSVIDEIKDVNNHASKHRDEHEKVSDIICVLPLLITFFSGVATFLSDDMGNSNLKERTLMLQFFSLLSTLFSALLTFINSYNEKKAYKETWLRQRLYYSMLMLETEEFCEKIGIYSQGDDAQLVKKYMENINKLRKKDYENFFTNMGCSNFEKK